MNFWGTITVACIPLTIILASVVRASIVLKRETPPPAEASRGVH